MQEKFETFQTDIKKIKLDHVLINVSASYIEPLIKFFKQREKRFR